MISEWTPPGIQVIANPSGAVPDGTYGIWAGRVYTVRGMTMCRHWRTREPDPHVLLEGIRLRGDRGETGFPRECFDYVAFKPTDLTDYAHELIGILD